MATVSQRTASSRGSRRRGRPTGAAPPRVRLFAQRLQPGVDALVQDRPQVAQTHESLREQVVAVVLDELLEILPAALVADLSSTESRTPRLWVSQERSRASTVCSRQAISSASRGRVLPAAGQPRGRATRQRTIACSRS